MSDVPDFLNLELVRVQLGEYTASEEECIICLSRRKTAAIVHGTSLHHCCCVTCGLALRSGNKPCPICREPIERVLRLVRVQLGEYTASEEECIICLSRRKTAAIVHGTSLHHCCCVTCGLALQSGNKPCPICREPIERVLRYF